jgi:hypothetical protein
MTFGKIHCLTSLWYLRRCKKWPEGLIDIVWLRHRILPAEEKGMFHANC